MSAESAEEAERADLLGKFTTGKRVTYKEKPGSKTLHGTIVYTDPYIRYADGVPYVNIHIAPIVKGQGGEPFPIKSSEIEQYNLQIARSRRRSIGGRQKLKSKTRRRRRV